MESQPSLSMDVAAGAPADYIPPTLSKNQQKKLKRDQEWEANRAARKAKRKEKIQERKQAKRSARERLAPPDSATTGSVQATTQFDEVFTRQKRPSHNLLQLPITLLLDCGFDELMTDKELKSLTSQITRSYSDNHKAPFQAHLTISSFGGHLKERFDGVLAGNHLSWRNVRFLEEDFVSAAEQAKGRMSGPNGGNLAGVFSRHLDRQQSSEERAQSGEVIYLTSDSPDTLTELRPYSTYIIGGLVDRNRHKGICYKTAMDRGIKTAKLPIGEHMKMNSRFVLATNHVVEIMLRWLELGDWGKAFDMVIPKRKGGVLKDKAGDAKGEEDEDAADDGNDAVEEDEGKSQGVKFSDLKEADVETSNGLNGLVGGQDEESQIALLSTRAEHGGDKADAEEASGPQEYGARTLSDLGQTRPPHTERFLSEID